MVRNALAALFLGLCALTWGAAAPASAEAPRKLRLALNWKAEPEFGGFYSAALQGDFKKQGLDVSVLEGGAGTPVIQMVGAGQMEYGIADASEVVIARDRGSDVVALFAVYVINPQGVMAHPARGFKTMKDVWTSPGTLAISAGTNHFLYLKAKYGNPKARIVPYAGGISSYLADPNFSQQCFVTSEPLAAKKKGKPASSFLFSDEGFNPYAAVLIARKSTLEKYPDEAKKLVAAVREGWKRYLAAPQEANQHMAKLNTAMDAETFREIAEIQKPYIVPPGTQAPIGAMSEARWNELAKQLHDLKVVKKVWPASELFVNY